MSWNDTSIQLGLLGLLWLGYFLIHSLLASLWLKGRVATRWPGLMPYYRLSFNISAMVLILPPLALMWQLGGDLLWQYQGIWNLLRLGLMGLTVVGFVWSLRFYDGGEFLGLRQLRENLRQIEDQERLHISPMHRFVRHPWYSLGLVLIWTQEMDAARLTSALMMTGYLVIGSLLEERKLRIYHGERYRRYQQRVPGLIPLPHRYLTREQAQKLLDEG
jgi:protein-S-isoprenylcysteine O-methyltransferase Ste14